MIWQDHFPLSLLSYFFSPPKFKRWKSIPSFVCNLKPEGWSLRVCNTPESSIKRLGRACSFSLSLNSICPGYWSCLFQFCLRVQMVAKTTPIIATYQKRITVSYAIWRVGIFHSQLHCWITAHMSMTPMSNYENLDSTDRYRSSHVKIGRKNSGKIKIHFWPRQWIQEANRYQWVALGATTRFSSRSKGKQLKWRGCRNKKGNDSRWSGG